MEPFDRYPGGGNQPFGKLYGANARHEYGLRLQQKTGEHRCAYCRMDLTDTYEHWLMLQIDHVVPVSVALKLGIPIELYQDMMNCVLACSACNGLDNRFHYDYLGDVPSVWTQTDFVTVRNAIFAERRQRIATLHVRERAFFDSRPWD